MGQAWLSEQIPRLKETILGILGMTLVFFFSFPPNCWPALVINIGDTLEIVSGGHFKATRHRVFKPPVDQLQSERLSLVLFNSSVGDLPMAPAAESPLIQREGCIEEQGIYKEYKKQMSTGRPVPTNRQWREIQIATATDPTDTEHNRVGVHQVIVDGQLMHQREYLGMKVLLPV
ncbi:hypothetical protein NUW58_g1234 [Xylaria curta]|uniref:Uncharacterized protein n=1 Tax=Xylaria curta TaxID=42375 RepID=A0ACC1PL49_9PEZI|nr:hypothetical protein NUW58_g1234 [Xylaria curta]